jgi:hypothetical protein
VGDDDERAASAAHDSRAREMFGRVSESRGISIEENLSVRVDLRSLSVCVTARSVELGAFRRQWDVGVVELHGNEGLARVDLVLSMWDLHAARNLVNVLQKEIDRLDELHYQRALRHQGALAADLDDE